MQNFILDINLLQAQETGLISLENMQIITIIFQLVIAISILNVWVLKFETIANDFKTFNFPDWFRNIVGIAKGLLCVMLIGGIWMYQLAVIASLSISLFMLVAVIAHYIAKHSFSKTLPALGLCLLCFLVAYLSWHYKFKG